MSWDGSHGMKPSLWPVTELGGESALQPYGPLGPKRIDEMRHVCLGPFTSPVHKLSSAARMV